MSGRPTFEDLMGEKAEKVAGKIWWSTDEVMSALAAKHKRPEWAFIQQVPDGTGMNKLRTADAVAMSLWPSRGIHLHGFEVKASRGDWLRELKNPAKAESIAVHCHFWWVVAGSPDFVREEEVPANWGLMVPRGRGLTVRKHATQREPMALSWDFLAGLLRRVDERSRPDDAAIQVERNAARREGYEDAMDRIKETNLKWEQAIKQFEEKSGVSFVNWDAGRLGEAVRFVKQGGLERAGEILHRMKRDAEGLLASIERGLAAAKSLEDAR